MDFCASLKLSFLTPIINGVELRVRITKRRASKIGAQFMLFSRAALADFISSVCGCADCGAMICAAIEVGVCHEPTRYAGLKNATESCLPVVANNAVNERKG